MMRFRTDFLVLPALVHAVEKGWLTLEEALSATNDPTGWTNENQRLEQHLHLNALLYDRGLLPVERWQELQPAIVEYIDKNNRVIQKIGLVICLFKHLDMDYISAAYERLLVHGFWGTWFKILAPRISNEIWDNIWQFIQSLSNANQCSQALQTIAPFVPDELVSLVFSTALQLSTAVNDPCPVVIPALLPRLNEDEFQQARQYMHELFLGEIVTQDIHDLLVGVLSRLAKSEQQLELEFILEWVLGERRPYWSIMLGIAPFLSEVMFSQILDRLLRTRLLQLERAEIIYLNVPRLLPFISNAERQFFTHYLLKQIPYLQCSDDIEYVSENHRLHVLKHLAPYLPDLYDGIDRAYAIVQISFQSPLERAQALNHLAKFAAEPFRQNLLQEALLNVLPWSTSNDPYFVTGTQAGLLKLIPHLDQLLLDQAFATIMQPPKPNEYVPINQLKSIYLAGQAHALTEMFPHLNDDQIRRILARMQNVEEGK